MALALRYAARSDVGLLRSGNEDSAYAGPRLLVVADGMGGHVAGEVASAVAVATLVPLDEDVPGSDLLDGLGRGFAEAQERLDAMVSAEPELRGMGTTLTALLFSGSRLGLAHVGDSRCYLLRGGELRQITHDDTFVQSLVDEGRISAEDASHHPQRSLITRALDGITIVEPDLSVREVRAGDRYLLCSDGLSGVVTDETLRSTLAEPDPEAAADALVRLALRGGGPDNITCIVADVVDVETRPSDRPVVVGAAEPPTFRDRARLLDTAAGRAAALHPREAAPEQLEPRRRRWPRRAVLVGLVVVVLAGLVVAATQFARTQFYVGVDGKQVAIFQGLDAGGGQLSRVYEHPGVQLADLTAATRAQVRERIPSRGLTDARRITRRLADQATVCIAQRANADLPPGTPRLDCGQGP